MNDPSSSRPPVLRVAVNAPLRGLFDYLPPEGAPPAALRPGVRLTVPFGRGERFGVLVAAGEQALVEPGRLKRAGRLLDAEPLLAPQDIALLEWAAGYYQHPVGEVIFGALPLRLRRGGEALSGADRGWRLAAAGDSPDPGILRRAPRQAAVLRALQAAGRPLTRGELAEACGPCAPTLRTLASRGWVEPCAIESRDGPPAKAPPEAAPGLNPGQRSAVESVRGDFGRFSCSLLEGVTGSGKTEVYLVLVQEALSRGLQALVLVPEIGLTPQLLRRFRRRIPHPVALLHSAMGERERERAWQAARSGAARVVIGTRSAVFTPLPQLGLVVVDEEHDPSFKQQEGFRYSARDLAVTRAHRAACPVVLGSATPSLESLENVARSRYRLLRLPERAGPAVPPRVDLVDIRSARLDGGLSPVTLRLVGEEVAAGNQVLLFLNRRGYAPLLTCHACGWIAQCARCDARMTLHAESGLLWCHHCGSQRRTDSRCPECGGGDLRPVGLGTERLEEALRRRFPERGIARIDRDSTRRRGSLSSLLEEIRAGAHSLLVGTQMLAKGHHFPGVTLVCILDVDQGLFGTDFRAGERMAQLLVQVAGRAGRAEKPGRVLVQTRHPDHPQLQLLVREGYRAFAENALRERREAGLPPVTRQVLLRASANRPGIARDFLDAAAAGGRELPGAAEVLFFGPVAAPMERRAGRYRAHLLVQADRRVELQRFIECWIPVVESLTMAKSVRWSVDVDPMDLF